MADLAVIGGTGLTSMPGLEITYETSAVSPYGEPSGKLLHGKLNNKELIFLPRHGHPHKLPPHKINYRANIWALKDAGVKNIIAINAVGGITDSMAPRRLIIPDQIIDYTYGREHTFSETELNENSHYDFTEPYTRKLRDTIIRSAQKIHLDVYDGGTLAVTQGPRLESAAEVRRIENDGCDLVGMTGMPEAGLAREISLNYAAIAIVANWAAGKTSEEISIKTIEKNVKSGVNDVLTLLTAILHYI